MKRTEFRRATAIALMAWLAAMLGTGSAQEWVRLREQGANFYDIQRSFYGDLERRRLEGPISEEETFEDKGMPAGYTQFKRWEYEMEPRVYPSGVLPEPGQNARAFQYYLQKRGVRFTGVAIPTFVSTVIPAANWTSLGPTAWVSANESSQTPGLGRISAIAYHPTNDIIFVGAPAGGLWKTVDFGSTWQTNTDALPVLGVSSIVINPLNPQIMYIATGDNDANHTPAVGVYKSIDGGDKWDPVGLTWEKEKAQRIYKLIIHPTNPNILLAATSNGIYKTSDEGKTWIPKMPSNWRDIEFKPGDPAIVYATWAVQLTSGWTAGFYRSTDTGETWQPITADLPTTTNISRIKIGVTAANPNYVYLLASRSDNFGFLGLYRSLNSGISFTPQSTTPNILGYNTDGSDAGGFGWYDLALAVSPINAEELYTGGINIWKSIDGGVHWERKTHWLYSTNHAAYVHADIHHLGLHVDVDLPPELYAGTDGGFFLSTNGGATWRGQGDGLGNGLTITQFYRIGSYAKSADLVYGGAQDNAISRYTGPEVWESFYQGDGGECFVDPTNSNIVYAASVTNKNRNDLYRSADAGATFSTITTGITEKGAWTTPYVMDPKTPTTLYAGYENVWKTIDSGSNWVPLTDYPVAAKPLNAITILNLQVAPSNSNYIYYIKGHSVYRLIYDGTKWSNENITKNLPNTAYTQIAVASKDPNKIWIAMSGYNSSNKVWASTNGGGLWADYASATLPNLPINTIVYHDNGGTDALYAGADVGVYYRDATMAEWEPYQSQPGSTTFLPHVPIKELEVHQQSGNLRAATFGRGLWQTPLVSSLVSPRGAALAFDGVDDYVISNFLSTTTTDFTIEAWVKLNGKTGSDQMIFAAENGQGIRLNNDRISVPPGEKNIIMFGFQSGNNLQTGTWTHLAVVGTEKDMTLYKDLIITHNFFHFLLDSDF